MAAVRWALTFDRAAPTPEPSHAEVSKDEAPRLATGKFAPLRQPEPEHERAGEGANPLTCQLTNRPEFSCSSISRPPERWL